MNMKDVKAITIPEGDVKRILINGVVVWEVPTSKVLVSITLSGQTTSLNRGAAFSFGGTVTATYSDSTTADVTASTTFSGYNMSATGTYTVTASYTENGITKTATYTLSVVAKWAVSWASTWIYKDHVAGTAFTIADSSISAGTDNGLSSMYIAYKVNNSGTAPAIWTSSGYRTGFTTSTNGYKVRICIVLPGGAIGTARSYSSNQDAVFTLPGSSTAGYTLVSNTQLGKAQGDSKYGKSRRVIFEYSGNGTITLTNHSSQASAGYYQPRMTISIS